MEIGKVNYGLVGMLWFDNSQVDLFVTLPGQGSPLLQSEGEPGGDDGGSAII